MNKKLWNKDFLLMLQGNAVSAVGDLLYSVAIGYWVYDQTGSSALMGIMSSVSMFISMFLTPFAGSIIDKCNRKWIIVGMDVLRAILMLVIGALAFAGALSVAAVMVIAALGSLCSVFFSPAVSTLMIDIIPHDDMVRGQSVHSGVVSLVNLVGKAFSGVLVAFLGVPLVMVVNGISYLISAITEIFIHVPRTVGQGTKVTVKSVLSDFAVAVRQIFADRFMKLFVPALLLLNLLASGSLSMMLPFCMEKGFTLDMYGYLMSVQTAASVICVVLLGIIKFSPQARYRILCIGFFASTLLWIVAYLCSNFIVMCVFFFFGAMLNAAGNAVFSAALMLALPEENRGAILGFVSAACTGGVALSSVIYGFLGELVPLYLVFVGGCVLTLIPMVYVFFHRYTKEFMLQH